MLRGKIILFFNRKEIVLGICREEQAHSLIVLVADRSTMHLALPRVVLASDECSDLTLADEVLVQTLRRHNDLQRALQQNVMPSTLWQAYSTSQQVISLSELARQIFHTEPSFDHQAAVLRALVADTIYFKVHGTQVFPRTPQDVEARLLKAQQEQKNQQIMSEGAAWLSSVLRGAKHSIPASEPCIAFLKNYAIFGKESPQYATFRELLSRTGITDQKQCFDLLFRLGIWDEDENLLLQRHGVPCQWSAELLDTAAQCTADNLHHALSDPARVDLTGLTVLSIDDPFTQDIDDALSITFQQDSIVLGVHIADPAAIVPVGSELDREASLRGTTVYFPEGKIPLLPHPVSENAASLQQGIERPALSMLMRFSHTAELRDAQCLPSVINVSRRLSYDDVDTALREDGELGCLYRLASAFRRQRLASGAIMLPVPELQIRVNGAKKISTRLRDKETPSQVLVSECMILANYCAARELQEKKCPAIFRRQAPLPQAPDRSHQESLAALYQLRRKLNRVYLSVNPGVHGSLGLPCYATVTSPLRKYIDLVNQRQLSSLVRENRPLYSHQQLRELIDSIQPVLTRAALVAQERKKYWLLKLLQKHIGENLEAIVLEPTRRGYIVLLKEYLLEAELVLQKDKKLTHGSVVSVILCTADPFYGTLNIELAS